jgi:hypothetical protein
MVTFSEATRRSRAAGSALRHCTRDAPAASTASRPPVTPSAVMPSAVPHIDLIPGALECDMDPQHRRRQVIHHSDRGSNGGLNWSSQHLEAPRGFSRCDPAEEATAI